LFVKNRAFSLGISRVELVSVARRGVPRRLGA
jgi:hypothetical protein